MAKKRRMLFAGCKEIYPGLAKTGRPATSVVVVAVTVVAVLVVWLVIVLVLTVWLEPEVEEVTDVANEVLVRLVLVTVAVVRVADVVLELARRSLEPQWSSPVKAKKKDRTPPHPKR